MITSLLRPLWIAYVKLVLKPKATRLIENTDNVMFAIVDKLWALGFGLYPFAIIRSDVAKMAQNADYNVRWVLLEEYYHAAVQQRGIGKAIFHWIYLADAAKDAIEGRDPYKDSELEKEAKLWVDDVLSGRLPNPIRNFEEVVQWVKNNS